MPHANFNISDDLGKSKDHELTVKGDFWPIERGLVTDHSLTKPLFINKKDPLIKGLGHTGTISYNHIQHQDKEQVEVEGGAYSNKFSTNTNRLRDLMLTMETIQNEVYTSLYASV